MPVFSLAQFQTAAVTGIPSPSRIVLPYSYDPATDPLLKEPEMPAIQPELTYYRLDHLGTPTAAHNEAGETVWEATYKAWGEIDSENVSDGLKQKIPFRFQGQYYDEESGLHYNRFRYYDPDIGRFISQDPIGLMGGENLYAYAPNPTGWVDPKGLCSAALNRALGGGTGDKMQAHHLIPEEIWNKRIKFLNTIGIGGARDAASNGLLMPDSETKARQMNRKFYHCGSHPVYSRGVDQALEKIQQQYNAGKLSKSSAVTAVQSLQKTLQATLSVPGNKSIRLF